MTEKKSIITNDPEKRVNRTYSASIFSQLFNDEKEARELFNLLEGTDYGEETKVEIQTLDDSLYVDRVNDLAFTIDGRLIVLIEHQKSLNANMPLRMLMYASRTLEKLYGGRKIFNSARVKICAPEFFVLYIGDEDTETEYEMRLSDAFLTKAPQNTVDLVVKVFNIRYTEGKELLKNDSTLAQYSRFNEIVRNVKEEGLEGDAALQTIMRRCKEQDILVDFLQKHNMEAISMAWGEFNLEEYIEGEREISEEKGNKSGEDRMGRLYRLLREKDRLDDYDQAIDDPAYRKELCKEFGI